MDDEDVKPQKPNMAWMVTFTDLVSLMLTFFVMLFAMSNVKTDSWEDMVDALSQSLNASKERTIAAATAQFNIGTVFRRRAINLDYLAGVLEEAMAADPVLARSQLMRLDDRLVVALPGDLLFESGRAVLAEGSRQALFNLGGVLRNIGNTIGVNGHTDPLPPSGESYTSNWELSTARSIAVANTLKRSGYPDDIIAFGFADSRFGQLPSDVSEEQRQEMARRVDIVILPTAGDI